VGSRGSQIPPFPLLKVEELLKEVRLSEKKKERIDNFLKEVTKRIQKVPPVPEAEVRQMALGQ
jgi:hypothetical protein